MADIEEVEVRGPVSRHGPQELLAFRPVGRPEAIEADERVESVLAATERVTLRALLEELGAAGLELVADAAFDLLQDPRRSIEEVNIAGLSLARLTVHQLPSQDVVGLYKQIAAVQRRVAVVRAFAPLPRKSNPAVPTTGYDDVKRVAKRLFDPAKLTIVIGGSLEAAKARPPEKPAPAGVPPQSSARRPAGMPGKTAPHR